MPNLSVGMPVFNGAATVEKAISTILAQSLEDIELVISDNASTDGTADICERIARTDSRVRLIRQPQNRGALANFKTVLDEARGEFFFWASHDDVWSVEFAKSATLALKARPDAAAAMGTVRYLAPDGSEIRRDSPPYCLDAKTAINRALSYFRHAVTDNLIYAVHRREVLVKAPFVASATPERILILSSILSGPIIDVPGMSYDNYLSFKTHEQVRRTLMLNDSQARLELKVFSGMVDVLRKRLSPMECLLVFPFFLVGHNWHKFLVKHAISSIFPRRGSNT